MGFKKKNGPFIYSKISKEHRPFSNDPYYAVNSLHKHNGNGESGAVFDFLRQFFAQKVEGSSSVAAFSLSRTRLWICGYNFDKRSSATFTVVIYNYLYLVMFYL